jgi:hypothetical protein
MLPTVFNALIAPIFHQEDHAKASRTLGVPWRHGSVNEKELFSEKWLPGSIWRPNLKGQCRNWKVPDVTATLWQQLDKWYLVEVLLWDVWLGMKFHWVTSEPWNWIPDKLWDSENENSAAEWYSRRGSLRQTDDPGAGSVSEVVPRHSRHLRNVLAY